MAHGKQEQNWRQLGKGLRRANQLEMKYEAALLYFQSGKYQASKSDLQKAAEEFESLGAKHNLEQVLNVLSSFL